MYPKIFKQLALRAPVLGQIVCERDRLRNEIAVISDERDRLRNETAVISDERDRLRNETAVISDERDRLRNETAVISDECDRLRQRCEDIIAGRSPGYCHCCRQETVFQINGVWLRDQYVCLCCFSIPRMRHLQHVLDNYFQGWEHKNIHESSPSNDLISRHCSAYSSSQYFHGVDGGSSVDGVRCENLESLTFPDCTFDIFITQDVFEHIFNPDRAAREIMRVLKPGGAHVFTAPKQKGLTASYPRASLVNSQIKYFKEAVYHGNPIGDGTSLVTWDYGDDFESLINGWSDASTITYITRDRNLGIDGEYLEVFVSRKNHE